MRRLKKSIRFLQDKFLLLIIQNPNWLYLILLNCCGFLDRIFIRRNTDKNHHHYQMWVTFDNRCFRTKTMEIVGELPSKEKLKIELSNYINDIQTENKDKKIKCASLVAYRTEVGLAPCSLEYRTSNLFQLKSYIRDKLVTYKHF